MIISGIYKFTNLINHRVYIGSSADVYYRYRNHVFGNRFSKPLRQALLKYGIDNFKFEILEIINKKDFVTIELFWNKLYEREQFNLDLLFAKEYIDSNGKDKRFRELTYNLNPKVIGGGGSKWTEESRENLKKKFKKEGHICLGRKFSEESINKMKNTFKERGVSVGKNNPNYGKKTTREKKDRVITSFLKSGKAFPFLAINKETGFTKLFVSTESCAEELNVWKCQIKRCLSGKYKSAGGFVFKRAEIQDEACIEEKDIAILKEAGIEFEYVDDIIY